MVKTKKIIPVPNKLMTQSELYLKYPQLDKKKEPVKTTKKKGKK
jgi:hypothetical protein